MDQCFVSSKTLENHRCRVSRKAGYVSSINDRRQGRNPEDSSVLMQNLWSWAGIRETILDLTGIGTPLSTNLVNLPHGVCLGQTFSKLMIKFGSAVWKMIGPELELLLQEERDRRIQTGES